MKRRREIVPDPWMFDVAVEVDGRPIQGQVMRFSRRAHVRFAWRRLLGKPEIQAVPAKDRKPE